MRSFLFWLAERCAIQPAFCVSPIDCRLVLPIFVFVVACNIRIHDYHCGWNGAIDSLLLPVQVRQNLPDPAGFDGGFLPGWYGGLADLQVVERQKEESTLLAVGSKKMEVGSKNNVTIQPFERLNRYKIIRILIDKNLINIGQKRVGRGMGLVIILGQRPTNCFCAGGNLNFVIDIGEMKTNCAFANK